jgi:hypothetical protein
VSEPEALLPLGCDRFEIAAPIILVGDRARTDAVIGAAERALAGLLVEGSR